MKLRHRIGHDRRVGQNRPRTGWPAILAILSVLSVLAGSSGCDRMLTTSQPDSTLEQLPAVLPALSPDIQDAGLTPRLVWIPTDSKFSGWGIQAVSDGWIAAGEYYHGSQGQGAQLEYYDQEGMLKWSYQRPLSQYDSCFLCAARRPDGSIIAGGRDSDGLDPSLGLLTAFDSNGIILWEQHIDYPDDRNIGLTVSRCMVADDGRILVVLDSTQYYISIYEGRQPTVLACFDPDGSLLWQKELDFSGMAYSQSATLDGHGGFYLAVYGFLTTDEQSSEGFSWLLQIDRDGREIWRKGLSDQRYQYQVISLVRDQDDNLLLACSARYTGEIPEPPAKVSAFHDRYRHYAYHPASLLKLDAGGRLIWQKFVNGEFGAASQDLVSDSGKIYWKVCLADDIVEPYIFMSIDHRSINHEILAVLDSAGERTQYCQLTREESARQLIQRIQNGQPVMIGWAPIEEKPEWTETIPPETTGPVNTSETTEYVEPTKEPAGT